MPSADSCFRKSSLVSRDLFLLQKAPSVRPLSLFSYEVNGSGALLTRFGKKNSVSNLQSLQNFHGTFLDSKGKKKKRCLKFFHEMHDKLVLEHQYHFKIQIKKVAENFK